MKRIITAAITAIALVFCLPTTAFATWSEDSLTFRLTDKPLLKSALSTIQEEASDSYVFQLSETADAGEVEKLADTLCEGAKLYRTNDLELVERLEATGAIEQYAADGRICLDGLAEDIEALSTQDYRSAMLGYSYASAHNITGSGVKIAMIDSGLWSSFSEHSSATILPGVNFLADAESEERSNVEDSYGHGTFATSIICGNDIGLASGVSILPLNCFDGESSEYSYVIEAINMAIEEDCDIINLSLGGTEQYPLLEEAVQLALDSGIIVIASAGNISSLTGSTGDDAPRYPAAHEGVISVGAVDSTKNVWKKSVQNSSVCVVAPGVAASGLSIATGELITNNGTSFAAPIVSATAALALSVDESLSSAEFTDLLASTAEDLGVEGKDNSYGYGLINPALLLATLRQDSESLILTSWNENAGISAYISAPEKLNLLSFYDENGRMLSANSEDRLCNYPIPDNAKSLSLFALDAVSFTPIQAARNYGYASSNV